MLIRTTYPSNLYHHYAMGMLAVACDGYDTQWSRGHVLRIIKDDIIESAQLYYVDAVGDLMMATNIGGLGGDGQQIARDATDADIFSMAFSCADMDESRREACASAQAQYDEAETHPELVSKAFNIPANLWILHRHQLFVDILSGFEPVWSTDHLCRFYKDGELQGAEIFYADADGDLTRVFGVGHVGGDGQDIPADATDEALFKMARKSAEADKGNRQMIKKAYAQHCEAAGITTARPSRKELQARVEELTARIAELEGQLASQSA